MMQLLFARQAVEDLERLVDFLVDAGDPNAQAVVELVEDGLQVLRRHPLAGRPAEKGLREMVIGRGKTGYVALYDCLEREDAVLVLAVRHQREAGFGQ